MSYLTNEKEIYFATSGEWVIIFPLFQMFPDLLYIYVRRSYWIYTQHGATIQCPSSSSHHIKNPKLGPERGEGNM